MKLLKDRILKDGVVKPGNILKVCLLYTSFQVCFVFPFRSLTVHDITVEDRHGVVFIYKPWFPALSVCLFPQIQPCFIRGYCPQCMPDGRSAQIGRLVSQQ